MKKFLALLALAFIAYSAQAVVVRWDVPFQGDEYTSWTDAMYSANISVVYIANTSPIASAADVIDAMSDSTIVGTAKGNDGSVHEVNNTWVVDVGLGTTTPVENGTYYLVFQDPSEGGSGNYAVSSTTYTSGAAGWVADVTVDPDNIPETFDTSIQTTWMEGSTWKAVTVPEPTALALLALGVAGLALRRKVA